MIRFQIMPATKVEILIQFENMDSFGNGLDFVNRPVEFVVEAR